MENCERNGEDLVKALNQTPELKRRLITRVAWDLLESEAFLEAYPRLYDPQKAEANAEYADTVCTELAQIITRLFHKNRVREEDAQEALSRAWEGYLAICSHSDKS